MDLKRDFLWIFFSTQKTIYIRVRPGFAVTPQMQHGLLQIISTSTLLSVSCELVLNWHLHPRECKWEYGTLVEDKMYTFTLESKHFIFNKCPIYTHDGASAKFSTNSHETDFSVCITGQVSVYPLLSS
jgi:hypothetical protein